MKSTPSKTARNAVKTMPSANGKRRVVADRPHEAVGAVKATTKQTRAVSATKRAAKAKPSVVSVPAARSGTGRQEKMEFYELLLALRGQLVSQVRNLSSATLSSTKQAGEELADVGSDNFSREIGLAMMTEDGKKLAQIQEALERLSNGTYGVCTECGKAVTAARLKAIPYAKLCIDCQAARELQDKYSEIGLDDGVTFGEGADQDVAEPAGREDDKEEEQDPDEEGSEEEEEPDA